MSTRAFMFLSLPYATICTCHLLWFHFINILVKESVDTSSSNANCYHIFYSIEHLISGYIQQ